MSIINSKAYLINRTDDVFELDNFVITANANICFWDTVTQPINQTAFSYLEKINANNGNVRMLVEDGYVSIVQDELELTPIQFMSVLSMMMYSYTESQNLSNLMSTGLKTDTLKESDGRQIVTPSPIGVGWNIFFMGADDDLDKFAIHKLNPFAPSGRGEGNRFLIEVEGAAPDPTISEFRFAEIVHIHDGEITWGPDGYWDHNDNFSIGIHFCASSVSPASGDGNCNLYPIADGYNMIIPAAGDGYYNVDLSTACPIRNVNKTGYWSVNETTSEVLVGTPGGSGFDLFDFAPGPGWFMRTIPTSSHLNVMKPISYRTEMIHPTWKVVISVNKYSDGVGWLTGWFTCFRKNVQ